MPEAFQPSTNNVKHLCYELVVICVTKSRKQQKQNGVYARRVYSYALVGRTSVIVRNDSGCKAWFEFDDGSVSWPGASKPRRQPDDHAVLVALFARR